MAAVFAWALATSAPAQAGEGGVSPTSPKPPSATGLGQAYPIQGKHEYWDEMGAGRNHQGVDIGSPCGTPLVAAQPGRVRFVKYHARAGNYAVIDVKNSVNDLVYMHMREPASVEPGQSVGAGTPIGLVGDTGNASGCHLHFEIWEGTYYGGGSPIDPMPFLESWDRHRKRPAH